MCGRFTNRLTWSEIHHLYSLNTKDERKNTPARFNIAPTQDVLFCRRSLAGERLIEEGRWSLVPHWAKEVPRLALFNARSETAAQKPAFRDAFRSRRCLIPADGYFEWTASDDGGRDPWFLHLPEGRAFSFAGLWAQNDRIGVTSCTILTSPACAPLDRVHDRMPIILPEQHYEAWLDPQTPVPAAETLLADTLDARLEFFRVGRQVNSAKYQGEDTCLPVRA